MGGRGCLGWGGVAGAQGWPQRGAGSDREGTMCNWGLMRKGMHLAWGGVLEVQRELECMREVRRRTQTLMNVGGEVRTLHG